MNKKNTSLLACFLFVTSLSLVYGQSQLIISNQNLTQGNYSARDEVKVQPITTAATTGTNQIRLFVDKSMILPTGYGSTNTPITNINRQLDLSLPVGSTPSGYSVSPFGSSSYSIPINIPPGTNSLVPGLSIGYGSLNAEGLLGYGWNLSGLTSISRAGKTIYHNGQADGINLDNFDWFTLDGNRLMATNGAYGQSATEYHTEAESFSRTISNGTIGNGPQWFKVETKDGLTMELGNTSDSRLVPIGQSTVLVWMVNKIYDSYGNYITFEYNNINGEVYIKQIKYTGNNNAGIQPYNTIDFYYDKKQEVNTVFCKGGEINSTVLLRSIEIRSEGTFFKQYVFKYNFNNANSYLGEVQEQGTDYSKLNSLLFCYSDDDGNSVQYQTTTIPTVGSHSIAKYLPLDFDQDGKKDLVVFNGDITTSTSLPPGTIYWQDWGVKKNIGQSQFSHLQTNSFPSGFRPSDSYYPVDKSAVGNMTFDISDLNGDGKEDLLLTTYSGSTSTQIDIYPYLSNGNGFIAPVAPLQALSNNDNTESTVRYLDLNGDQKLDVFNFQRTAQIGSNIYNGICKTWLDVTNTTPTYLSVTATFDFSNAFAADINGDGKAELVNVYKPDNSGGYTQGNYFFRYQNNQFIFEKDNSGFNYTLPLYTTNNSTGGACPGNLLSLSGDFNGDAKTDFIYSNSTVSGAVWNMYLGKGDGTYKILSLSGSGLQNPFVSNCNVFYYTRDINADGKTDILEFITNSSTTTLNVYYSTGIALTKATFTINEVIKKANYQIDFGDFNGDGTDDLFLRNTAYGQVPKIFYFYKGAKSKYLKQAVNGLNTKTEFEYAPLSSGGSIYSQVGLKVYPLNNFKGPLYVVTKVTIPDGVGGSDITTYSYEDAVFHKQGKGFLGFSKVTSINNLRDLKTVNEFSFDPTVFNLLPVKSSAYLNSSNALLSQDVYVNQVSLLGSNRYYHKVTQLSHNNNIAGYTNVNNYQYDANGNLTYQKTTTGTSIEISEVTNTYTQSGAWIPSKIATTVSTITRQGQIPYTRQINYTYNSKGQSTQVTLDPGKPKSVVKTYTYDNSTGVLVKDEKSAPSSGLPIQSLSYQYDQKFRFILKTTNALNQIKEINYDPKWGNPILIKDIDGLVTQYNYDGYGRIISTVSTDGIAGINTYAWVNSGEITPGVDPLDVSNSLYSITNQRAGSPTVKIFYDQYKRERKSETDGLNNKLFAVKSYTAKGALAVSSGSYETVPGTSYIPVLTTNTYDNLNRLTKSQAVAGSVTNTNNYSYTYTSGNTIINTTAPDNKVSSQTSDPTDLLIAASDNGGTITYQYYSNGLLKSTLLNGVATNNVEYDEYAMQTKLDEKNSGITLYNYNAYGQLISQTNANNKTYQFQYDVLNRITQKSGPDGVYAYQYVTTGNGLNLPMSVTGPNGISYAYSYDQLRRNTQVDENINGLHFITSYQYDEFSNIKKQIYPSGFAVDNVFDIHGYHKEVRRSDNSQVIWQLNEMNPLGQYTKYTLGNSIQTQNTFTNFGLPLRFKAGNVQDLNMSFNSQNGNLDSRNDAIKGLTENFTYDNLDRLTNSQVINQAAISLTYLPNGNINTKTGIGTYTYNGIKQNAVEQVDNTSNLISGIEQNISYTPFNKAQLVTEGDNSLNIIYGPDNERKKTESLFQGALTSTRYFANGYEKTIGGGTTTEVHYINCASGLVAMYVIENGTGTMYYPYRDHLGSILTVTNTQGVIVVEQNFDPWGNKRNTANWSFTSISNSPSWLFRGFTGHEHLPQFGLVNMNGRMYDPLNGRMLNADNYVQAPDNTQNYNRYSYVMNNPLKYTDPDGNFLLLFLFATENGYDLQKYISPAAFKVNVSYGTHQRGIGIQASIGSPQISPGVRVNGSVGYYSRNYEITPGWQTTYGYEIALTPFLVFGSTHYNNPGTEFDQTLGNFRYGVPGMNIKYENDGAIGFLGDDGDRFRTGAGKIQLGGISVGMNFFTGDPGKKLNREDPIDPATGKPTYVKNAYGNDPDKYRAGVGYIGIGPFRFGNDTEKRRNKVQNQLIHDHSGDPHFKVLDRPNKSYFQFGTQGGFLW